MEHLVLSGSGPNGLAQLACLQRLQDKGNLDIDLIKSMYGVSAGGIICVLLLLGIPIQDIVEYLLCRPWNKVFDLNVEVMLECNEKAGLWSTQVIRESIMPFFQVAEVSIDITMAEFYQQNHVELHILTTALEKFHVVDLHHSTFPDLKVIEALQMSSVMPLVFMPFRYKECIYLDGAFTENYPLMRCLSNLPVEEHDKVLGIHIYKSKIVPPELSMIQLLQYTMIQIGELVSKNARDKPLCKYDIACSPTYGLYDTELWKLLTGTREERMMIYNNGLTCIDAFLEDKSSLV